MFIGALAKFVERAKSSSQETINTLNTQNLEGEEVKEQKITEYEKEYHQKVI